MSEREGVIKFTLAYQTLSHPINSPVLAELSVWRDYSRSLQLLGQDPERYHGLGYGNISARETGAAFVISASQTSGLKTSDDSVFARVQSADLVRNHVASEGMLPPSSESMSHAAIYQCLPEVNWVLHSHCPEIWTRADALALPATAEHIPYGTPDMAMAVQTLVRSMPSQGVFVMKGHQDGVVSYGHTAEQAVTLMVSCLARAKLLA